MGFEISLRQLRWGEEERQQGGVKSRREKDKGRIPDRGRTVRKRLQVMGDKDG